MSTENYLTDMFSMYKACMKQTRNIIVITYMEFTQYISLNILLLFTCSTLFTHFYSLFSRAVRSRRVAKTCGHTPCTDNRMFPDERHETAKRKRRKKRQGKKYK